MTEARLDGLASKVDGQLATVMAEFKMAEIKRTSEFDAVQRDFVDLKRTLPTKDDITKSTRNWALLIGGFIVGMVTLLWMFFDTGTGITGSIADHIIANKETQNRAEKQFSDIQKTLTQISEDGKNDDTQTSPRKR